MKTKIEESIMETAQTCYNYMLTEENKERILNPFGKKPILDVRYSSDYTSEITSRLYKYVEGFLKSKEVVTKFIGIKDELVAFYKAKCLEMSDMETDCVHEYSDANEKTIWQNEDYGSGDDTFFTNIVIALGLALRSISVPVNPFVNQTARKRKIVEKEYNDFKENKVRKFIRNELTKNIGDNLKQLLNKVTQNIKRRLQVLDESTEELLKSQREIMAKCNKCMVHARQIKSMEEKCHILKSHF